MGFKYLLKNHWKTSNTVHNWDYGPITYPYIITIPGCDAPIKTKDVIHTSLKASLSRYCKNWEGDLKENKVEGFLKEVCLPIYNRDKWLKICKKYGLEDKIRKGSKTSRLFSDTRYFLLDYFWPEYGFAVEIDSNLHSKEQDLARDEYVWEEYKIKTYRVYEYSSKRKPEDKEFLKKILSILKSSPPEEWNLEKYLNFQDKEFKNWWNNSDQKRTIGAASEFYIDFKITKGQRRSDFGVPLKAGYSPPEILKGYELIRKLITGYI